MYIHVYVHVYMYDRLNSALYIANISDCRWGGPWISQKERVSSQDSFHDCRSPHNQGIYSILLLFLSIQFLTRSTIYLVHSLNLFVVYSQVINIINAAQENSPITVVQALDKVLEILRTSQLYSPHFVQPMKEGDTMTSDLVGGLVSVSSLPTKTNWHQ